MTNLKIIRKYRKRRDRIQKIGILLVAIGFLLTAIFGGEGNIRMMTIIIGELTGCGLLIVGAILVIFIEHVNRKSPLSFDIVDEGDDYIG